MKKVEDVIYICLDLIIKKGESALDTDSEIHFNYTLKVWTLLSFHE
jgi:hypothetical protein